MTYSRENESRTWGTLRTALPMLLVLVAAACGRNDAPSSEDALGAADAYFAAFNAGDDDAVLASLTSDALVTDRFGSTDAFNSLDPFASEVAAFTGQGTQFRSISCTVVTEQPDTGTTVSCDYETLDALTQAVDALPVPTNTSFTVTSLGITEIRITYVPEVGQPDFEHVGTPFRKWLAANRPDIGCLSWYAQTGQCRASTSVEQDRELGVRLASVAQEWAEYLLANNCDYLEGC